jgi:hypothetical protein
MYGLKRELDCFCNIKCSVIETKILSVAELSAGGQVLDGLEPSIDHLAL